MAVITSSISTSAASKAARQNPRQLHTGLQNPVSKPPHNLPNQSKRRSRPAIHNMPDQTTSSPMVDVLTVLEALNMSITGDSSIQVDKMAYLTSPTLIERWQAKMNFQLSQFLGGNTTSDAFESRLRIILVDVERLERMRDSMQREASDGKAWEVVNERCKEVEKIFEGLERRLDGDV